MAESDARASGDDGEVINGDDDQLVLDFLDSLNRYLVLKDSLSSALRQGWLELASARHSMGSLRISGVLLDHNVKPAATTVQTAEEAKDSQQAFTLSKWSSSSEGKSSSEEEAGSESNSNDTQLRHRGQTSSADTVKESDSTGNASPTTVLENNVRKERTKALSVFGGLVSPRLRTAQFSFETALDFIVEIANARAMMLSAHSQLEEARKTSS